MNKTWKSPEVETLTTQDVNYNILQGTTVDGTYVENCDETYEAYES